MPSLALAALCLSACVTVRPDSAATAPVVTVLRCGTLGAISAADQAKIAAEVEKLPAGSPVAEILLPDWSRMRDEIRACRAKAAGP